MKKNSPLAPPKRINMLLEARTAIDLVRMVPSLVGAQLKRAETREDLLVIVVPGFGADDHSMRPLRHFLGRHGFLVEGWGLGRNLAGTNLPHSLDDLSPSWQIQGRADYRGEAAVPYLCDRLTERVAGRYAEVGRPVALIGWSLGGYLARETARDLPDVVDRVITFGSPIVGGPKYTAAAPYFEKRGMDLDWIEEETHRREARPIRQPITAIYSKTDAVVHWQAAVDRVSEDVRHIEVNAAHLGLGINPTVWRHVIEALEPRSTTGREQDAVRQPGG